MILVLVLTLLLQCFTFAGSRAHAQYVTTYKYQSRKGVDASLDYGVTWWGAWRYNEESMTPPNNYQYVSSPNYSAAYAVVSEVHYFPQGAVYWGTYYVPYSVKLIRIR